MATRMPTVASPSGVGQVPSAVRVRLWSAIAPLLDAPRQVVVLTAGRSGSELLIELLNAHPNITAQSEILRGADERPRRAPRRLVRGLAHYSLGTARARGEAAEVFAWKAVGHHLTWYPDLFPDPVAFLAACTADDGLLVVLRRRNFVTQALSLLHAEEHGYHFRGPGAAVFAAQRVEPERLLAQTQFYAEQDRWLAETARAVPSVELTYEDDLVESPSRQQALDRITGHLGLPPVRGGVDLVAVAPRSPAQRVANLDEVTAALAGTRWEGLLADA